jgi:SAM-dependent methyltransferase
MGRLRRVRRRLRPRQRARDPVAAKHDAQLRWWLEEWEPVVKAGGLNPGDTLAYLEEDGAAPTYWERRWQIARSQVQRVLSEAAIEDEGYFAGKVTVEVGPGPLGFPDACPSRVSIGVDPLAERYAAHGLLLPNSRAIYVAARAEEIPLLSASAGVVLARNTLDFVDDPAEALREMRRLLRPGGQLILLFDVDHVPSPSQPNGLTLEGVRGALEGMTVTHQHSWDEAFGHDGHRVVLVAELDLPPFTTDVRLRGGGGEQ